MNRQQIIEILEKAIDVYAFDTLNVKCIHPDNIPEIADRLIALMQPDGEEVVYMECSKEEATGFYGAIKSQKYSPVKQIPLKSLKSAKDRIADIAGEKSPWIEEARKRQSKSLQPEITEWLENKIKGCDELGDMEEERWAFQQVLKKLTPKTK